jgi:hypothetical protein
MNRAQRIAAQLGMSQGAANNKLRKAIVFSLVQETRKDTCYKCGEKIQTVDDFSIEHKLPWEGRDSSLFWDLTNITFSHLACNRPHVRNANYPLSRKCSENFLWCWQCQSCLSIDEFSKNAHRRSGREEICISCRKINRAKRKEQQ